MRALVVEDEARIAGDLAAALREAGFAVDIAVDGREAEYLGATESYDAVVLDLGLPGLDGIAVLEAWRGAGRTMPVLILTARDAWSEKVRGFRAGADDYVIKPFRLEEVVIRMKSLVRRAAGHASTIISCGPLSLDTQLGVFTLDGVALKLTAFEWRVLSYLVHHAERPVTRTELSEHLYERDTDRDFNSLEVIIGRLRRKIGRGLIETVRGQGYRLSAGDGA
ncbi:response regulator transcription factor [Arsenicitalea aurantiaca]|uniref:Response regulator transcription factor n=1 Tax=Arsenicitalea aurantiaca TaxID=1783274 RepID=A0A433X5N7_9HYPH|nr:response regulator transcription factor [Arsenicitalea aurantiaca]RUT29364.1 response regulator transcription factor [Arsenicitalea aurantiaca]